MLPSLVTSRLGSDRLLVISSDEGPEELFLPQVAEIFRLAGTQAEPVVGVEIAGLTIRHTRPTYMEPYTVPSGGDYR